MTTSTCKRKAHLKYTKPTDLVITPFSEWLPENRRFHADFCFWLKKGSYGPSARNIYSVAARFTLGYLNLPYKEIQPEHIEQVRAYLETRRLSPSTLTGYCKGLNKLVEFLQFSQPKSDVNWDSYFRNLPSTLANSICEYVTHCVRAWREDNRSQLTRHLLSQLSTFLKVTKINCVQDITPKIWFAFVEARLKENVKPSSLNANLRTLQSFLCHLQSGGQEICERMLEVRPLKIGQPLPHDLSVAQVKSLLEVINDDMDRVWFLLMLHSGLRTCEVRNLRISDVDLSQHTIHIRETKNQSERVVFLSPPTVEAIRAYLANREGSNEYLFTRYHRPLSKHYCQSRLKTLGKKANLKVTPHQLRHTCATLLLNAGMSIFALQSLLGHRYVETTLNYARLYDQTMVKQFLKARVPRS